MGITYIVVVHIHICPLSHCAWNNVQLWSIHIYLIVCFFLYYFSLFLLLSFPCQRWYTFSCDTALIQWNVSLIYISVLLFYSCGVHRPVSLWYCIWKIQHTKFLGGMCDMVKLISPLFTIYTFDFIVNNSFLYLPKSLIIFVQPVHTF